jgi:steroid 5-alpha reductase family enzyme
MQLCIRWNVFEAHGTILTNCVTCMRACDCCRSPVFVYVLLTRVSGIPMLEKAADERWNAEASYQKYKATTPILFPFLH